MLPDEDVFGEQIGMIETRVVQVRQLAAQRLRQARLFVSMNGRQEDAQLRAVVFVAQEQEGPSLLASMPPPCAWTMCFAIARPRPVPPPERERSAL